MDLLLWRHADAEELPPAGGDDMARRLTSRGERQAARMATWLERQLPEGTRILVSPARRTEQTAQALGRRYRLLPELGPTGTVDQLLQAVQWPDARMPTLVIGHQPTLGQTLARLLGVASGECSVRKGAVWWLHHRVRETQSQTVVMTVQTPELR